MGAAQFPSSSYRAHYAQYPDFHYADEFPVVEHLRADQPTPPKKESPATNFAAPNSAGPQLRRPLAFGNWLLRVVTLAIAMAVAALILVMRVEESSSIAKSQRKKARFVTEVTVGVTVTDAEVPGK